MSKIFQSRFKEEETEIEIDMMNDNVGSEEHPEKILHFTVSGIFALIVSFYQIKQLMNVDVQYILLGKKTKQVKKKILAECKQIQPLLGCHQNYSDSVYLPKKPSLL